MIDPHSHDIGRAVVYLAHHPGAKPEDGVITSFNEYCVFVRYRGDAHSKGTRREDLEWQRPTIAEIDRMRGSPGDGATFMRYMGESDDDFRRRILEHKAR